MGIGFAAARSENCLPSSQGFFPLPHAAGNSIKKITTPSNTSGGVPPATRCVRVIYLKIFHRPPDVFVFSPRSITITPLLQNPESPTHLSARHRSSRPLAQVSSRWLICSARYPRLSVRCIQSWPGDTIQRFYRLWVQLTLLNTLHTP